MTGEQAPTEVYDLVVLDAEVVNATGRFHGSVGVKDGRVAALATGPLAGARVINAAGRVLLPGTIDAHCHFRISQGSGPDAIVSSDDYLIGPRAAAFGGITTFIDFAIQPKGVTALDNLKSRIDEASSGSVIDFAFHTSITDSSPDSLREIEPIMDLGSISFKFFMTYRKFGFFVDHGFLLEAMRVIGRRHGVIAVHAEDDDLLEYWRGYYGQIAPNDLMNHSHSRPELAEELAIRDAARLAREANAELYIVHVSSAAGLAAIVEARTEGTKVWAETCPHYLAFTHDVYAGPDARYYTMTPSLRAAGNREALWEGVENRSFDVIASDHNSFTRAQKELFQSFLQIPPGLAGTEMLLPFVLSEGVNAGRLRLEDAVRLTSYNPAQIYKLPTKGAIEVGKDADMVLVDLNEERVMSDAMLHDPQAYTVFAGQRMRGWPVMTISRGEVIVDGQQMQAEPGRGRYIARSTTRVESAAVA